MRTIFESGQRCVYDCIAAVMADTPGYEMASLELPGIWFLTWVATWPIMPVEELRQAALFGSERSCQTSHLHRQARSKRGRR